MGGLNAPGKAPIPWAIACPRLPRVSDVPPASTVVMLGTPGFVRDPARFDDPTLLRVLGE